MKSTSWMSLGVVVLVLPILAVTRLTLVSSDEAAAGEHVDLTLARWAPAQARAQPTATLLSSDPVRRPHGIAEALVADVDAVPAGARIDVATYWLDSRRLLAALTRAHERGVVVRVVVAGVARARTPGAVRLARRLERRPRDPSRWVWSDGPARTAGPGILHEKTFRFSQVGDERWVVVTGSYNAADEQDRTNHALMLRVGGRRDVYAAFARVGAAQLRQRPVDQPLRRFSGTGWSAYFLPTWSDEPSQDPVVQRLRSIPARRSTVVRIAMYSMWGPRATTIAGELTRLSRAGARVVMVAGPTVDPTVRAVLRAGGVRVVAGCWRDGTFTHSKDMSASFVRAGERQRWTWVGSDNWTSRGLRSDQAVLGLRDPGVHRAFNEAFDVLLSRPPGVYDQACPAEE